MKNLFLIIIITFNNLNAIKQTLDSVINQSLENSKYVIIVVDNNLYILKSYNVSDLKIYRLNSNSCGTSKLRNVDIDYSMGKYVHFLDVMIG
ncbi:glycosyltransferase family 2 protein [Staphylococcus epidermidis]|nr:glycosyltransferase family 2 protein [Staphylococcus epidermidis]MCG2123563.1 glycosyltransferase family 2 protein [Staphylococcus epidermidis]